MPVGTMFAARVACLVGGREVSLSESQLTVRGPTLAELDPGEVAFMSAELFGEAARAPTWCQLTLGLKAWASDHIDESLGDWCLRAERANLGMITHGEPGPCR